MPVVEQEPYKTSGQGRGGDCRPQVSVVNCHENQRAADQYSDSGSQTIHAINEIPNVHASQKPEQGGQETWNIDREWRERSRQVNRHLIAQRNPDTQQINAFEPEIAEIK